MSQDYVKLLAQFCAQRDNCSAIYKHETQKTYEKRLQHKFTVTVLQRFSVGKPKKEEGAFCGQQREAQQMAAKKMVERLQAIDDAKKKEKIRAREAQVETCATRAVEAEANGAAQEEKEGEKGKVAAQGAQEKQEKEETQEEEKELVFDLADEFDKGKKSKTNKIFSKPVAPPALLKQTTVLQPWQEDPWSFQVLRASQSQTECQFYSYHHQFTIRPGALANAIASAYGCELSSCSLQFYCSTVLDLTKDSAFDVLSNTLYWSNEWLKKKVCFNMVVDTSF